MKLKMLFLFFCTIFVVDAVFCQKTSFLSSVKAPFSIYSSNKKLPSFILLTAKPIVPMNYAVHDYAFFCRQEWKWERQTGIPFRFRLGSLAECNRLEGKKP
jgi:hypothetical protein